MHSPRKRSASISSPISISFPSLPSASPVAQAAARPPHRAHRPSLSNTMSRLKDQLREKISENVASVSGRVERVQEAAYAHAHRRGLSSTRSRYSDADEDGPERLRRIEISEPTLTGSTDSLPTRLAPLGSGAIVVSTPQEALELTGQRTAYRASPASASTPARINQYRSPHPSVPEEDEMDMLTLPALPPSRPNSPRNVQRDFPTSRLSHDSDCSAASHSSRGSQGLVPESRTSHGSTNRRGSPLVPSEQRHSIRSAPEVTRFPQEPLQDDFVLEIPDEPRRKSRSSRSRSSSEAGSSRDAENDAFAAAPQLPMDLASALPQPDFEPILMSHLPPNMHKIDPAKLVVIIETSTSTLKSTYKTLASRPSFLARYLKELVASTRNGAAGPSRPQTPLPSRDDASVYSRRSEYDDSDNENSMGFHSLFRDHLASTGVIKPTQPARRADVTAVIHIFLDRPSSP